MSCRPLDVESFRNRARLPKGITRRKRGGYDESKKVSRTLLEEDTESQRAEEERDQEGEGLPPTWRNETRTETLLVALSNCSQLAVMSCSVSLWPGTDTETES